MPRKSAAPKTTTAATAATDAPWGFEKSPKVARFDAALAEMNAAVRDLTTDASKSPSLPEYLVFIQDIGAVGRPHLVHTLYRVAAQTVAYTIEISEKPAAPIPAA